MKLNKVQVKVML